MAEDFFPASFWNELYTSGQTAWDVGYVSTPIKEYIDQLANKRLRILVPGAGRGYEAVYLAQQGFTDITVVDISPMATQSLKETARDRYPSIKIITGDFFELDDSFDLVLEQTFVSTIPPSLRKKYAAKIKDLLTGNGRLAGVLFNKEFEEHPPYGGSIAEYRQLFSEGMRIKTLEECYNSIPQRQGAEVFLIACKL